MAFAETFKDLLDPVWRQILDALKEGLLFAGNIGPCFEMTGTAISFPLKILRQAEKLHIRLDKYI